MQYFLGLSILLIENQLKAILNCFKLLASSLASLLAKELASWLAKVLASWLAKVLASLWVPDLDFGLGFLLEG